jgi:acetyl-CoA acetyltransferase
VYFWTELVYNDFIFGRKKSFTERRIMNVWVIEDEYYDMLALAESAPAARAWVAQELAWESDGEGVTEREVDDALRHRFQIYPREVYSL